MITRQKIGVIGGGQLAWMMAIAAKHLDIELTVQAASPDDSAVTVADRVIYGKVADASATAQLADHCQAITFENEFVDLVALQKLTNRTGDRSLLFLPKLETLAISVDKLNQRQHFREHHIPTPEFYAVDTIFDLLTAAEKLSYPLVLKARRHGYDGKGTWVIADESEMRSAWESMHQAPAITEAFIPFERELAVIAARSESGEIAIYPVVETLQTNQVCRRTIAPARVDSTISKKVETIAQQIVTTLDAIGIFGIEFFLTAEGEISVNEIAPRTHNSGHYTIEGCKTSQFEQLLRVVSGQPLGSVLMVAPVAVMVNLLGFEKTLGVDADYLEKRKAIASFPNTHIHWYGKKSSSVGRKLGHVTILADSHDTAIDISDRIESIWYGN
ncbi:5-(carboxyamino)imidazole ribonucleotide synthase [Pseudanabaena galeata UHCC 0370]|uniref:N5-carboxyaminoimidazole ribonucleotide synthase n=1 Tax=Pseudanabaena galeata UHCC 0370 TaxID=3110310 RepID=A0ABU5TJR2_9CYAN|nr:5-(carboxyamino)imidazole ribonucleotide synthase [Pseudanabaena galeata]MEA5478570.1 5-(carboxyamino)imidazole ribonucleotide synthase [Pseudanabaena galeata UHCC 0370]